MAGFFARYLIGLFLILYFREDLILYIETPLLSLSQTFLSAMSLLPLESLRMAQDGRVYLEIPPLKYFVPSGDLTNAFCIMLPLVHATSVGCVEKKARIFICSIICLSFLEMSFIIMDIYRWLISNHGFSWIYYFDFPVRDVDLILSCIVYSNEFHVIFILGIWAGITYICKKRDTQSLIDVFL